MPEITRDFRLAVEQPIDKFVLVGDLESRVEKFFVAECGRWNRAQTFAASAARAMPRPDLQIIGKVSESLDIGELRPRTAHFRAGETSRFFEQIGAANIACKQAVPGENPHRAICVE